MPDTAVYTGKYSFSADRGYTDFALRDAGFSRRMEMSFTATFRRDRTTGDESLALQNGRRTFLAFRQGGLSVAVQASRVDIFLDRPVQGFPMVGLLLPPSASRFSPRPATREDALGGTPCRTESADCQNFVVDFGIAGGPQLATWHPTLREIRQSTAQVQNFRWQFGSEGAGGYPSSIDFYGYDAGAEGMAPTSRFILQTYRQTGDVIDWRTALPPGANIRLWQDGVSIPGPANPAETDLHAYFTRNRPPELTWVTPKSDGNALAYAVWMAGICLAMVATCRISPRKGSSWPASSAGRRPGGTMGRGR